MDFKQWYTVQKTLANLVLLEEHLTDLLAEIQDQVSKELLDRYWAFREKLRALRKRLDAKYGTAPGTKLPANTRLFCMECMSKHLWMLQGLADEGIGFFPGEEMWGELRELVGSTRRGMRPEQPVQQPSCPTCMALGPHLTPKFPVGKHIVASND